MDPGHALAMDPDDLWKEDGVLTKTGIDEVRETLNPMCERTLPEGYPDVARGR